MALKKETIEKIKAFGFDADKLIAAVKAEAEVDYDVPERVVMTQDELSARDANKIAEGKKEGERAGEEKGKELAAKAIKKKFAIEGDLKDVDKIAEAVEKKLATGDQGLKDQIQLLQKDKEALSQKLTEQEKAARTAAFDAQLISMFPANRSTDLSDSERLALVKMNLAFEEVDGKTVVKKGGEIVRDKNTQNPLDVSRVIQELFTEKKWVGSGTPPPGGRGGSDTPPPGGSGTSGIKSMSKFKEQWKAENPSISDVSPQFQAALDKHVKDIPDFDWYN